MDVYLLDGTYELFRHHFAVPSHVNAAGREVAAVRGVIGSVFYMLENGTTHLGVATDHVIESFRNEMWATYKTSAGMDPILLQQFPLLEEALEAMGVLVWPMVEVEADDALGSAAVAAADDPAVETVYVCSPDKDLAQCVIGSRVVQMDRRNRKVSDEAAIVEKFGVLPQSIPDYLALVGDSADGFPGLPGWGAKSASALLYRFGHFEAVPASVADWGLSLRGMEKLAQTFRDQRDFAYLFRDLATLRTTVPVFETVDDLCWRGPTPEFETICAELESPGFLERARFLSR